MIILNSLSRHAGRVALVAGILAIAVASVPADTRFEERLALDAGGTFRLDTDRGSVTVSGGSSDGVIVVVTSSRDDVRDVMTFDFRSDGNVAEVQVDGPKGSQGVWGWLTGRSGQGKLHFEIRVPGEADVEIDTAGGSIEISDLIGRVNADTSGGGITVRAVRGSVIADTSGGSIQVDDVVGDAKLDTSGGGIDVTRVQGAVDADTSGGSIRIADVSGDIRADTSGGSIRIAGAGGRVEADTSGGGIEVEFAAGNDKGGVLDTSGGGITVAVDGGVGLDIDAECSSGRVQTDLPITVEGATERGVLRGRLNGGGATLRLRTSAGGIRIGPL